MHNRPYLLGRFGSGSVDESRQLRRPVELLRVAGDWRHRFRLSEGPPKAVKKIRQAFSKDGLLFIWCSSWTTSVPPKACPLDHCPQLFLRLSMLPAEQVGPPAH